jgi:V8-like Glu-specific endopeptidase
MRARILLLPLLGALSVLGVGLPAHAAQAGGTTAAAGSTSQLTSHAVDHSASTVKAIAAYWTPQRMREAIAASTPKGSSTSAATLPESTADTASPAAVDPPAGHILSRPTGPKVLGPMAVRPDSFSTTPTQGRVFFHNGVTNVNSACSAGTVNTPNGDMVVTAAHCVYANFSFMQDWIYVPAYYNGPGIWGTWFASNMAVTASWKFNANPNDDFAIVNVAPASNGLSLVNTTGGNGLVTDQAYTQNVVIWGYPGSYNDGLTPEYCTSSTFQSGSLVGAPCNLSQGASGGPWLTSFNGTTGLGYEFGETSTENTSFTDNYSPYFGSDFISLYGQNVGH